MVGWLQQTEVLRNLEARATAVHWKKHWLGLTLC